MSERDEFEKWLNSRIWTTTTQPTERCIQRMWIGWQAARESEGGGAIGFIPDSGINNLDAGHPARVYPVGSMPSPFEGKTLVYAKSAPQPDKWIPCSERLPTEADADFRDDVLVHDKAMRHAKYQQCLARWNTVDHIEDYTHWMPTGITRPASPEQEPE